MVEGDVQTCMRMHVLPVWRAGWAECDLGHIDDH